jgi:hypothetical protein
MILISYIKPFVIVHSEKIISGKITINSYPGRILYTNDFSEIEYLNVKVKPSWPNNIRIIVKTEGKEIMKVLDI